MNFVASTAHYVALATIAGATIAGGLLAQPAAAAPFCMRSQSLPPQCIYYDAQECDREAQRQGATCATNPGEFTVAPGFGQFCVITTSKISVCAYADRQSCAQDAARQHGTCIDAPRTAAARTPDPYSPINGN